MVFSFPVCRVRGDGGDCVIGRESAADEGAYHPGPALAIPPPTVRRSHLESAPSSPQGRLDDVRWELGCPLGEGGFHPPMFELRGNPAWTPTAGCRTKLDEPLRDPLVVQEAQLLATN